MKRINISDVARRAGVSISTVDRVVNERAGVRRETVDRVQKILQEFGYSPNRLSAYSKVTPLNFVALIPQSGSLFMDALAAQIKLASSRIGQGAISIDIRRVSLNDANAFLSDLKRATSERPDGLILVAIDTAESRDAIDDCVDSGVPVVTLISDVPQSKRDVFIGIDNLSAGRTAGELMARFLPVPASTTGTVAIIVGQLDRRDLQERRAGFEQRLAASFPNISTPTVPVVKYSAGNADIGAPGLSQTFPNLLGFYSVVCADLFDIHALHDGAGEKLVTIGHELTECTRQNLVSGVIDAIVAQDCRLEADQAVQTLASICRQENVNRDMPPTPISIYLKENLPHRHFYQTNLSKD